MKEKIKDPKEILKLLAEGIETHNSSLEMIGAIMTTQSNKIISLESRIGDLESKLAQAMKDIDDLKLCSR
jgi:hypothetical protein